MPPVNPASAPAAAAKAPILTPPPRTPSQLLAYRLNIVSGVFCAVLAVGMVLARVNYQAVTPLDAPKIIQMKAQLVKEPRNDALKEQIRAEDLRLRTAHARYLLVTRRGAWMLIGGMLVFLGSMQVMNWRKKLCVIKKPKTAEAEERSIRQAGVAVGVLGAFLGVGAWWLAHASETTLSAKLIQPPAPANAMAAAPVEAMPSPEEFQRNWPRFRGPDGAGVSTQTNVPLTCDIKSGANVAWHVPVPVAGHNSPIIWGDRLFISGGTPARREVVCFDTKTGAIIWQKPAENVPGTPSEQPEISDQTGVAAATMATDGKRVYAMFATAELVAFNLDGSLAWAKSMAPLKNQYGHAASLLTWQNRLILQLDQGEADESKSKLYAFDGATGKVIWQTPRKLPSSWASPIVIQAAGKAQIITLGIPLLVSYSATDGVELWRSQCLANEVTPSPVFAGGLLYVISPSEKLMAFRPDGQGDVSTNKFAWVSEENVPDVTSPVSNGEFVFTANSGGMAVCYEAKTGKKVWEHDFETEFQASPTIVGDRLYLLGQKGAMIVVQAAAEFKELARSQLEDKFMASPAIAQNHIFLRGQKQLYCLGAKDEKLAAQK